MVLESLPSKVRVPPNCGIVTFPAAFVDTVNLNGVEAKVVKSEWRTT